MSERHNHRIVVTERGEPEVLELVEERLPEPKAVKPIIDQQIPLAEAPRAHELLAHGRHAGKIVLTTTPGNTTSEGSSWT